MVAAGQAATGDTPAPPEMNALQEQPKIDLTSPDQEALTPHGGAELAGALAAEGQAATGDTLAPPEMNMLQEQPKIDLTSPDQEALMPHDGAELAGALAAEGQAATGDMPAPPGNMRDGWSTDGVECYSDLTIKRWPTAQWVATGDRPGDHTITSLRYKTGREGLSVRLSLPDAYNTDGWVTPEDLYDMICESYGCLSTAGHPNDPVLNHWDDSWSSGIDEPGWYGVWSEREAIAFLGAVVQHNAVVLIQAVARRREVQRRRKEQTAAMPEHASTSNSSGPAPPPHTPTKGSSSRSANEPGSPAVSRLWDPSRRAAAGQLPESGVGRCHACQLGTAAAVVEPGHHRQWSRSRTPISTPPWQPWRTRRVPASAGRSHHTVHRRQHLTTLAWPWPPFGRWRPS